MDNRQWTWGVVIVLIIFVLGAAAKFTIFGYILHGVDQGEIAVQLRQNKVIGLQGPGVYHDSDWFASIENIDVRVLRWCAFDSEVLTKGENSSVGQRVGIVVCGTVQRPGYDKRAYYLADEAKAWNDFKQYYTDNLYLVGKFTEATNEAGDPVVAVSRVGLMQNLAQQAMKVCVGDSTFSEAVVGSKRDTLATCIQEEVSGRADKFGGLVVSNVTVPNVVLTPEARALVDLITASQMQTDKAAQDAKLALAQGTQQLAQEQATIRVEQGKIQETARQKAITAALDVARLEAERAVIEATASNNLLTAERALSVNQALFEANMLKAKADRADDMYYAGILRDSPAYTNWLIAQVWSLAIKDTDKIIPVGSNPYTIINPWPDGSPSFVLPQNTTP